MKLSIIVPIYNVENYLEECLNSLSKQSCKDIEFICINDGSIDNSLTILNKYSIKDERFKIINKTNGGLSSARNEGIKNATGEYLYFVDGDDYIDEFTCSKLIDILNSYKVDTLFTGYFRKDWNNQIYKIYPKSDKNIIEKDDIKDIFIPSILGISFDKLYGWFEGKSLNSNNEFPTVWRFVYSNKIIKENNIFFNERLITGEDIIFNLQYLHYSKRIKIVNECYYYYIWRKGSLSNSYEKKIKFFESKVRLIEEREKLNDYFISNYNIDYSKNYEASIVLSLVQMALTLSECTLTEFYNNFKLLKKYSSHYLIRKVYKKLNLFRAPLKYKIPLYLCKNNCNLILFIGCYILNKLDINIYPN